MNNSRKTFTKSEETALWWTWPPSFNVRKWKDISNGDVWVPYSWRTG